MWAKTFGAAVWAASVASICTAHPVKKTLTVTRELGAPDGNQRYLIKVNGQFPAPPLYFDEGDDVEITVHNRMPENTTIHWHGILQAGSQWSDGVPGLTQKPIEPGKSFVYRFKADPAGTYWYHSHVRAQLMDGLYGPLFIRRKKGAPKPWALISNNRDDIKEMEKAAEDPYLLILSDWDKYNSSEYLAAQRKVDLQLFCVDSILINGKGSVLCPPYEQLLANMTEIMIAAFNGDLVTDKGCFPLDFSTEGKWVDEGHPELLPPGMQSGCVPSKGAEEIIEVDPKQNSWISLNFIGAVTLKDLRAQVDEHVMWVYEVDGQYIEPRPVHVVDVTPGERFSVLIKLDKPGKDYTLRITDNGITQIISGYGTLRYKKGKDLGPSKPYLDYNGQPFNENTTKFLDKKVMPPYPPNPPAKDSDVVHLLRVGRWFDVWRMTMTGRAMYPADWHAYDPFLFNLDAPDAFNDSLVIRTKYGQWVDLVVELGSWPDWPIEFSHAIHKHGTKFWVIGNMDGEWIWNNTADAIAAHPEAFNLVNPPYRDTALNGGGDIGPESWMVLRYQVTNPGPWLLHCHVDTHLAEGLAMVLMDGVDRWPTIPREYQNDRAGY